MRIIETTYRPDGRLLAAYIWLQPALTEPVVTEKVTPGLMVDRRSDDGVAVGIEVYDPEVITVAEVDRVLRSLCEAPLGVEETESLSGLGQRR